MLKIALIGLGNMGKLHLKNLLKLQENKKCMISGVCDIKNDLTDEIKTKYNIEGFYNVYDLVENCNFDAAIIATTSSAHFEVAKVLIENGKHVLIEKPVVLNVKDAEALKEMSKMHKVLVSAGYTEIYNSVTEAIISFASGEHRYDYADFFRIGLKSSKNDTKDIDIVQDLIVHDLAITYFLSKEDTIKDIYGTLINLNEKSKKYDTAAVTLLFENNRIVRLLADRNGVFKKRKATIARSDSFAEFDFMEQTGEITKNSDMNIIGQNIWYSNTYHQAKIRYVNNPLLDEISDFINAIENNTSTKVSDHWFNITLLTEKIRDVLYRKP